ncbi:rRNA maturation RNase YbeY [Patescibacteria group bacterium]|nr:rRNA maturation RNase YbeY [Patescibacteria group bacterium]MBU4057729.1 rRNA maturation RNase YbeY [Patescibacteria group bacterium]MBU4116088.1 rRNA maturation RNase YbeY [Patescibacteria group bacterium]
MPNDEKFSITKTIKGNLAISRLPFINLKNKIVGKNYNLSLVFIGDKLSKKLNKKYRKKDKKANALSFPLTNNDGEIFINISETRRQSRIGKYNFNDFLKYLFIHSLLHLKGYKHSSKMESEEQRILRKFRIKK